MGTFFKNKYLKFVLTFASVCLLSTFFIDIKNIIHWIIVLVIAFIASISSYTKENTSGYNTILIFEAVIIFIFVLLWIFGLNKY